jgi:hypothetical protein
MHGTQKDGTPCRAWAVRGSKLMHGAADLVKPVSLHTSQGNPRPNASGCTSSGSVPLPNPSKET